MDLYLSDVRDQAAAEKFSKQAINATGVAPEQITTDKESALYPAIKNVFNDATKHRDSKYMNNRLEQNHHGIKSGYRAMKGFKNPFCALTFCTAFEELRQFFRMCNKTCGERRQLITSKIQCFNKLIAENA